MIEITSYSREGLAVDNRDIADIAKWMNTVVSFARDKSNRLYYYTGGVYKQGGEDVIAYMYRRLLEETNSTRWWKDTFPKKLCLWITAAAEYLLERPAEDKINFRNGIYNIQDNYRQFEPHDTYDHSGYRTTVQIPIDYNPSADCPQWREFLHDVFPEDIMLLVDIVGLCMIPFTGLQKCIVLLGAGSNGKGTFLNAIQKAIGSENYTNLDLKRLLGKDDRFSTSCIVGKLVNVVGDVPPTKIENTALFKALTGQDTITVEYKGKQPFSYHPFARLIFSCNEMLETGDNTVGYKRRFFCIPFDAQFSVDPKKKMELEEGLASPEELSGLINMILPRLATLVEEGLQFNEAAAAKVDNYVPIPEWFRKWSKDNIIVDYEAKVPSEVVYLRYAQTIAPYKPSDIPVERSVLINYLKATVPAIVCNKAGWYNGRAVKCYHGFKLTNNDAIVEDIAEEVVEVLGEILR